ncbi:PspC domain-containing protein [Schaalia sp. HMT-877]|nr:PspC domain-containing protein [Schaalia sp. HMT-877]
MSWQQQPSSRFFDSVRASGWYRSQPRVVGGVCAGISARTGWDLSLVRVLVAVLAFFAPPVVAGYGLAWLFLPEARDGGIHAEELARGRIDIAQLGGIALAAIGLSAALPFAGFFGPVGYVFNGFWFFALVSAIVAFVVISSRSTVQGGPPMSGTQPNGAPHSQSRRGGPADGRPSAGPTGPTGAPEGPAFSNAMPHGAPQQGAGPMPGYGQRAGYGPRPGYGPASGPHRARTWTPAGPKERPRLVSARVTLAVTGLIALVFATVFAVIYWLAGGALDTPNAQIDDATSLKIAQTILIGGGVCLLISGFSLVVAAVKDRSSGWLLAMSIIGVLLFVPTSVMGMLVRSDYLFHNSTNVSRPWTNVPGSETSLTWEADTVTGSPVGTSTLDLTGAPVGTTKTITVTQWSWNRVNILVAEGQPVQIICRSDVGSLSTSFPDGQQDWVADLGGCADADSRTPVSAVSPGWGKPGLGGITIEIGADADLSTLHITQTRTVADTGLRWDGSDPAQSGAN